MDIGIIQWKKKLDAKLDSEMSKKQTSQRDILLRDIKDNFRSFSQITRNGWIIKLSTYRESNIMLIFCSVYTNQAFVRYFEDDDIAVKYINIIISKNSSEIIDDY